MEETLSRSTLIQSDKELLEKTLAKSPSELSKTEIGVIRARQSYLTAVEREVFKDVLEVEEEETKKKSNRK